MCVVLRIAAFEIEAKRNGTKPFDLIIVARPLRHPIAI